MSPPTHKNFFELFGLPTAFGIDVAQLAARYRELAREVHPDRFASGSESERRLAMQMTTFLNEGLRVLKNPISRAQYLLQLHGIGAAGKTAFDNAFLVEQMELRERLEDASGQAEQLAKLAHEVEQCLKEKEEVLVRQLASQAQWQQAMRTTEEMQFLDKLHRQIQDELE